MEPKVAVLTDTAHPWESPRSFGPCRPPFLATDTHLYYGALTVRLMRVFIHLYYNLFRLYTYVRESVSGHTLDTVL